MKKFNLFKMLAVLIVLITSINTAWATWYCPGTIGGTHWDNTNVMSGTPPTITFSNISPSWYEFQFKSDDSWSGNGCLNSISGLLHNKSTSGGNAGFNVSLTCDVVLKVTETSNKKGTATGNWNSSTNYYVTGPTSFTGTDWGATPSGGKFTDGKVTFSDVASGNHQFKLTDGTNWSPDNVDYVTEISGTVSAHTTADNNMQITVTCQSNITFTQTANGGLSVHGEPVLYIAGNGTGTTWCAGQNWDEDYASCLLSKTATDKYSITFDDVDAGDYQFKITDGGWTNILNGSNFSNSSPSNVTLSSSETPNYNICFTLTGTSDVTVLVDKSSGSALSGWKVYVTVKYSGLTVSAANTSSVPTISATTVNKGSGVTVTANAATGYEIDSWSSDNGSFANASAASTTFTPTSNDAEAVATYKEKTYSVTVATANSSYGKVMDDQTSTTVNAKHFTSDCEITATPEEGYRFAGWTKTGNVTIANAASASTTIKATSTGATVTATFEELPAGQLEVVAGAHGSVKIDGEDWTTTSYTYTDQNDDVDLNIYAKADANYHFVNWTKVGDGTIKTNAATGEYSLPGRGSATVTANFAETTYAVTIGTDGVGTVGSTSPSGSTQVGAVTPVAVSAPAAKAGYKWGRWVTSANVTAASPTSASTSLTATGTGTATATYDEDLSTTFYVRGGGKFDNSWDSNTKPMTKKTGHSTESVAYFTVSIDAAVGESADTDYDFKIYNSANSTEYGLPADGAAYWWTRSTTTQSLNASGKPIQLRADIAGDYEIKVDYSGATPTVTVTFPTTYQVNYAVGTVKGQSDDPSAETSASVAVADGDYVLSGTSVTFTADNAKDGYTWAGWYDAATTAGTKLSVGTSRSYTTTISAATTVYAVYTENLYTVTVSAGDHGSISVPVGGTVSAGADTKPTITASPSTNYAFKWWSNTDGNVTATDWNSASTTVSATAAGMITANFFPQWALAGGDWNNTADDSDALGDWDTWTNGFEGFGTNASSKDTCIVSVTLPANTDFKFKIVDHRTGDWYGNSTYGIFKMTYADNNGKYWDGHVNSGSDEYQEFGLATAGAGSYKFAWNKTDKKAAVFFPTSYKVTFGYGTGGTSVSASVSGSGAGAIANNQYAASGSNITFSESHSNGYTFKGWYDAASGGSAVATMGKEDPILNSIAADASVYAQYTENMTTVTLANNGHGHVEIGGETVTSTTAGVTTTRSITAVPDAGYYFSGWIITEGTDFHLNGYAEANATATLTGNGDGETSGQTLTANFVELDKIYFRNIFDDGEGNVTRWESVYVHFDITWAEHDGKQAVQTSSDNISKGLHCSMTKIGTSDVYWAYVPRYITTNSKTSVAFADHDDSYNNSKLWEGNAAGRGDYNPLLNMFVPHHTKLYSTNSVDYYSNGYWMKYDTRASQGAGYYLKVYNSRNNYTEKGEFTANTDDATMIRFQVRVDNTNADKTRFMITSAGGLNYIADATVTSVSGAVEVSENLSTLTDNDVYFQLTATSEGYYTFILDQTGDEMKLSVDYPVAVGDYRLKHTYNDGSAHTTYSDIIKSEDAATGVIASMYLNTSNSPTFVLEKCTAVSPKIVWTQQGSDLWSAQSGNFNKGKGVYQFDITITDGTTSTINSITEAKPYEGNYYIKTDCAPGGWTAYKSNVLDKNTINFDRTSNTFDYYMCRNTRVADKNVKFVIANDYNIAVTDTIDADATYLTGGNNENVPEACCVRFSYNSVTNDAKRAYLRYSSNNNFLNIIPSAASKVYDAASAGNDLYGASGAASANNKFGDDDGNFVYRKTVYAVSGASIAVKAEYTTSSKKQTFVTGHQPITSSSASTRYPIQVVYDFKTNNLTTAWHPGASAISDEISKVNYMYIRNGQAAADQLSFSGSGALTDAKVCGAFQFAYDDYVGKVGAWPQQAGQATGYTNEKCMFYFSFPFNVKVSDIFGIGTYGKEWKIQYYDGEERAKKGFFRGDGTTTFWKDMSLGDTLKAYRGYSLLLDNDYFNTTAEGMVFNGKSAGSSVYLYFPSYQTMSSITSTTKDLTIAPLECKLENTWYDAETEQTLSHKNTDSHWNMLGVPLLSSQTGDFSSYFKQSGLSYLYAWNSTTNTLTPAATGSSAGQVGNFTFQAMGAYMVQFTGTIRFSGAVPTPSAIAARQKEETKNYTVDLEVLDGEDTRINHTYVELREGASDDFMLNEDMYMTRNSNAVNIYSFAGDYDVAANVLSVENHVVPVGVSVKKAGTYKFSMPYEFSGTVTLVDKFNNTRTNLAFDEYEVYLEKGSINDRFDMEINIHKVPTSIENVDGNNALNDGGVHKFIENDQMYILKNGAIYNAQGVKVK